MTFQSPFYRIYRPIKMSDSYLPSYEYLLDETYIETYCSNRAMWNDGREPELDADIIFEFVSRPEWEEDEMYDFDWGKIKGEQNPFKKFNS